MRLKIGKNKKTQPAPAAVNPYAKYKFGHPAVTIGLTLLIFFASQFLAAFVVGAIYSIFHGGTMDFTDFINSSDWGQFFFILIAEGLAVTWTISVVKFVLKLPLASIGLGRRPRWKDLQWAVVGALLFYFLAIIGSAVLSLFISNDQINKQQDVGFDNISTAVGSVLAFVSLVILPPIAEEILVRGYLFSGLRSRLKFWPAAIVTSFLFGLAHLDSGSGGSVVIAAATDTFILSMVLVYVRESTGALYAGMLIHATNNLVAYTVHFK